MPQYQNSLQAVQLATLLSGSRFAIFSGYIQSLPNSTQVAASLLRSQVRDEYSVIVVDQAQQEKFTLDIFSTDYVSRGDWRWVTDLSFYYKTTELMTLSCSQRLIDLPYSGSQLNVGWLLTDFKKELRQYIQTESS